VNQLLASLQGQDASAAGSKIKLNFKIGGTYDNPKVILAGTTNADGTTTTVKQEVKQQVDTQVESAKVQAEEEADKLVDQATQQAQPQIDTLSKKATEALGEEAGKYLSDSASNDVKKTIQNIFQKKKKN
jgi:vacuolar-type H+-ATPase subunit H